MMTNINNLKSGLILVTGPTNSGKSKWAEYLLRVKSNVTYIATSAHDPSDTEWSDRILKHQKRRSKSWRTIESKGNLIESLKAVSKFDSILIDSLGGYVAMNLELTDSNWDNESNNLISLIKDLNSTIIIVTEEVGWSVVPHTELGHLFRERLTQFSFMLNNLAVASWLVVGGYAIDLYNLGVKVPGHDD